jgi:hypothetical protein
MISEMEDAKKLISDIAEEIRHDASNPRIKRSIHLILESFTPEHIVTELLQNADDVGATFAKIELTRNGIFFSHNGKTFDENHLRALCDIGQTTKKPGVHIGFMGIGFKAAFKISDKPYVFSGPYRFYFRHEDVFVPYWIDHEITKDIEGRIKEGFTTFFLPFRKNLPSEVVDILRQTMFKRLEPLCLIFLRNVIKIEIVSDNIVRILEKRTEAPGETFLEKKKVHVFEKINGKETTYSYLVFNKTLEIPEQVKNDYRVENSPRAGLKTTDLTLVFNINEDSLKPMKSVLYTFLATSFETGLRFAINCDFLLNTQRSEPDFTSSWNLWLLESIGEFLKEIIYIFIFDEKRRFDFYDVLPRRKEVSDKLFLKLGLPLIGYLKNSPCILTSDGKWAKPSEVALVSGDVAKIIPPVKAGVKFYVDPGIRGCEFLKEELDVKDLTGTSREKEYVLEALKDEKWFTSLRTDQIRDIYDFLYHKIYGDYREAWHMPWQEKEDVERQLKQLNIVKATDGRCYKAEESLFLEESGKQPSEIIELPCMIFVDPVVLSDRGREFLKKLGVKDFSDESVVNKILDSQGEGEWKDWTEDQRLRAVSYVAKVLREKPLVKKKELCNLVLPLENGGWARAAECYIPVSNLKEVLPNANFVDLQKIKNITTEVENFLNSIGVLSYPRIVSLPERKGREEPPDKIARREWTQYWRWLGNQQYSKEPPSVLPNFLDGFDECVTSRDETKLMKYLNFLLEHWDDYYKNYLETKCHWFYRRPQEVSVHSYFAYQIKTSKWLPTSQGLKVADEVFAPFREIRRIGGNLLAYLNIPEQQARKSEEFLQFLGVKTKIDLQILLHILDKAKNTKVDDMLKAQLSHIYREIVDLCKDEKIEKEVFLLDENGDFKPARELVWMDYPIAKEAFQKKLSVAWVPENLSRPDIQLLFSILGVRQVSKLVDRKLLVIKEMNEDAEWTKNLQSRKDFLYSILQHHKANGSKDFPGFIKKVVIIKTNALRLQLKVLGEICELDVPCSFSVEEGKIYISSKANSMDIARELANAFEAPPGTEFAINFVLSKSVESILNEFQKSGIQLIRLPEVESESELYPVMPTSPLIEPIEEEFKKIVEPELVQETVIEGVRPVIVSNLEELNKEIKDVGQFLSTGKKLIATETRDLWKESKKIEKVVSEPRIEIRPSISISTRKNWEPKVIDGERVFVEVGIEPSNIEAVKPLLKDFKKLLCKIVEIMGGNPDTVNICIANPVTDGDRREGQLFFNILRNDSQFRWVVVVARELAYLKFQNLCQSHINLMTELIEKALKHIDEIYPDIYSKKKD